MGYIKLDKQEGAKVDISWRATRPGGLLEPTDIKFVLKPAAMIFLENPKRLTLHMEMRRRVIFCSWTRRYHPWFKGTSGCICLTGRHAQHFQMFTSDFEFRLPSGGTAPISDLLGKGYHYSPADKRH